jgi:hypothetical protein
MAAGSLTTLLQIRLLVGFLGERPQFAWWPTSFYGASSRLFLEPVFANTSRLAQYHGVVEAARRVHDENLSVGSFHLFRLPEEVEQDLHGMTLTLGGEELVSQSTQSKEAALNLLMGLAGTIVPASQGPTVVGKIKSLDSPAILKAIPGIYFSAFKAELPSYPYFVE